MVGSDKKVEYRMTFDAGSKALKNGTYVCVPCGLKRYFKEGEVFPRCLSCMKGKKYEGRSYAKGLELWEFVSDEDEL